MSRKDGAMSARTLIVIRHAKSDWSVGVSDRDRPLAPRGRRQAPLSGDWLASQGLVPDLALVSVAARARQTWELVSGRLPRTVPVEVSGAAYTFDGVALRAVIAEVDPGVASVALVGHNPAVEELVEGLTGQWVPMPTSALAVIDISGPTWGAGAGVLRWAGRPADLS